MANDSPAALIHGADREFGRSAVRAYRFTLTAGTTLPLRVVLTWTEPPGSGIVNQLGLQLIRPGGGGLVGNAEHLTTTLGFDRADANGVLWDRLNCVEQILVGAVTPGEYLIRVVALVTSLPPQGFALVVSGEITEFTET